VAGAAANAVARTAKPSVGRKCRCMRVSSKIAVSGGIFRCAKGTARALAAPIASAFE
jgi:hypothetical protein